MSDFKRMPAIQIGRRQVTREGLAIGVHNRRVDLDPEESKVMIVQKRLDRTPIHQMLMDMEQQISAPACAEKIGTAGGESKGLRIVPAQ